MGSVAQKLGRLGPSLDLRHKEVRSMPIAPNATQIFVVRGQDGWTVPMVTANTTRDGTSGTTYTLNFTGDTDGSFLFYLSFVPLGTNVATVARLWENNGSSAGTAANNTLVLEVSLPATTASETVATINATTSGASATIPVSMNKLVRPGYNYFLTIGTAVSAGWKVFASGGTYTA